MRQSFLHEVANHYISSFPETNPSVCIIFPNRRASTFFKKTLLEVRNDNQWLPEILSSQDLVKKLSSLQIIDSVRALFELYKVYQKCEGESADSFDLFSTWASQLLHDFQEIDLYCVDADKLYSSVDAAYAMKNWSPDRSEITPYQGQYLKFWSKMGVWYNEFRKHLLKNSMATSAMSYRFLAENISTTNMPWKHFIFAGFNALNTSEKKIIKHLEKRNQATLLWDLDSYYTESEMHEAGHFARDYMRDTGKSKLNNTGNHLREIKRKIHITGVAKNIGQTIIAGSVLNKMIEENVELSNTALVLCDEQLLMPTLEVLPESLSAANITMGYPMHLLPVATLFSAFMEMHIKSRTVKVEGVSEPAFYYKDLLRILRNPVFASLLPASEVSLLILRTEKSYEIFLPVSKFISAEHKISEFQFLLNSWNDDPEISLSALLTLSDKIRLHPSFIDKEEFGYDLESLFELTTLLNRVKSMLQEFKGFTNVRALSRVFQQLMRQLTLPFLGEPLSGLQIMGLLETRNLDFKNLIVLSVNENIIPAAKSQNSFIPFDIAQGFGLPTYRERDAVFAYHFYRMIQRAENVWLIYNTESDEFGKGEKSRYITQIIEELKDANTEISTELFVPQLPKSDHVEIVIDKTPELIQQIIKKYDGTSDRNRLSPTALSSYFRCSLQYYFRYFSGIKIDDTKDEEIGANELGDIAHKVLEILFADYLEKPLSKDVFIQMLSQLDEVLEGELHITKSGRNYNEGKAILIKHGIKKMLSQYLKYEIRELETNDSSPSKLKAVEQSLTGSVNVETMFGEQVIHLGGKADRIDFIGKELRVIDYKTGTVDERKLKLNLLNDIFDKEGMDKALQLFQYVFMAMRMYKGYDISAGILSLRKPSSGISEVSLDKNSIFDESYETILDDLFSDIASEILNNEISFSQTKDLGICAYCDYASICNR
ncbi:MAG: PD-(D/E)XK nuclease family protein [Bacteroidia bacterium]